MKSITLKSILKFVISLGIALGLLYYAAKDIDIENAFQKMLNANFIWILLSIFLSLTSHWMRAYRWNLMIEPLGYELNSMRTFFAVMTGYLANLAFPRAGEVSRCAVLKKTDNVPIATSVGTVVVERLIDLCCLIFLLIVTFMIEFKALYTSLTSLQSSIKISTSAILAGLGVLVIGLGVVWFIWKKFKFRIMRTTLFRKVLHFWQELLEGITSIRKLEDQGKFWFSTVGIWVLYYLMSYIVVFALEETANLGPSVGLSLLVMGGIGMSAPVQGGIGPYHLFVSTLLVFYGLSREDGMVFATLLHTSQTISVIVVGTISAFLATSISRRKVVALKPENA